MSENVQQILAVTLITLCGLFILWNGVAALVGRRSRLGSCCAKGCQEKSNEKAESNTAKVQFLPVDLVGKPKQ